MSAKWRKIAAGMYTRTADGYTVHVALNEWADTGRWFYTCTNDNAPPAVRVFWHGDAATLKDAKQRACAAVRAYHHERT